MGIQRTDLAIEAAELLRKNDSIELPGVVQRDYETEGCGVTEVKISSQEGANRIGKPIGTYLTLELSAIVRRETDAFPRAVHVLSQELSKLLEGKEKASALVVGLGNRMVTPDAIGPRAVDYIMVTRHLIRQSPEHFAPFRPVSAVTTGVLGTTGVESGELIEAVTKEIRPDFVIAIDALAARSVHRLCSTVQIADTGIVPGSGVGNARKALNQETLGVPVIAIGVPTVVDADTLAMDLTGKHPQKELESLLVTPKDIDVLVSDMAKVVGHGVDLALQNGLEIEDIDLFLS
jgi:spore protease